MENVMNNKFEIRMITLLESINGRLTELVAQKATKRRLTAKSREDNYTEEFDVFWNAYPRKVKKPDAAKCYRRAVDRIKEHGHDAASGCDSPHELLTLRAIQYAQAWSPERMRQSDGDFRQHPSTWLNNDMFLTPEEYQDPKFKEATGPKWEHRLN